eukprot:CCRYP_011610-RA/>CCRYP_011610-RA protein AED:0.36 eAED:0.36 QI:0/-1/0/1/-1/1/1/0/342
MISFLSLMLCGFTPTSSLAFKAPTSFQMPLQSLYSRRTDDAFVDDSNTLSSRDINFDQNRRRLLITSVIASILPFPLAASADQTEYLYQRQSSDEGDLTSRLFNPDGSLRDPNMVVEAQERPVVLSFPAPNNSDGLTINVSTDGSQPTSSTEINGGLRILYKVPTKWNNDPASSLPLYFDSSEGKNGKACNRITVYSVAAPKLDASALEKASKVGVAKSLFMDSLSSKYFDQGVLKADLISGRTTRKPIKMGETIEEQVYYEFDLAFAPLECPTYLDGNKENLGLGFCPYDSIFLISATVVDDSEGTGGTMVVCVVESTKDEWKIANSDLKRVRSSFEVNMA